jgi:anti-anti-sigma factor
MPIQNWSDRILLVSLQDDPQFTDDMNALSEQLAQRKDLSVLLDLAEVNFLNSSNIARMLKLRKTVAGLPGCRLKLCGIQTSVWGVFLVTGLDKLFEFADDVPTGLASFQMGPGPGGHSGHGRSHRDA